jgi:hypothetical protein
MSKYHLVLLSKSLTFADSHWSLKHVNLGAALF